MEFLFIYPPNARQTHILPMGLAYIGAILMKAGHKVKALDIDAYRFSRQEVVDYLRRASFDAVCISGLISVFKAARWVAREVRQIRPEVPILAGGPLISSHPKFFLEHSDADIAVDGEGEDAILEIVDALEGHRPLENIPGIVYKKDGQVLATAPRGRRVDLDSIPFPANDLFPVELYLRRSSFVNPQRQRHMAVLGTRGCPYPCTYCDRAFGKKAVYRSPESIVAEMQWLKEKYRINVLTFVDDFFFSTKKRVMEFCELMIKANLNIRWNVSGRVDQLDREIIRAIKAAGCEKLGMGIESGSEKILEIIKKHISLDDAIEKFKMMREEGISPSASFIYGLPGEDEQTTREHIEFRKKLNRMTGSQAPAGTFWITPLPGTELYKWAMDNGRIADELAYIEKLSDTNTISKFLINLTDMPTERLWAMKAQLLKEIEMDYYRDHRWKMVRNYLAPRFFRYSGIELWVRACRKALRIYRRKRFLASAN